MKNQLCPMGTINDMTVCVSNQPVTAQTADVCVIPQGKKIELSGLSGVALRVLHSDSVLHETRPTFGSVYTTEVKKQNPRYRYLMHAIIQGCSEKTAQKHLSKAIEAALKKAHELDVRTILIPTIMVENVNIHIVARTVIKAIRNSRPCYRGTIILGSSDDGMGAYTEAIYDL